MGEPKLESTREHARARALEHIRKALELCDHLGETLPACHLQLSADLLAAPQPLPIRPADEERH